jgi:chromosome partitioning protein
MTGHVIAVANMKGGVGKTATVVMLSHALAADDAASSVVIVDVDAQASASFCTAGDLLHSQLIEGGLTTDAFIEDLLVKRLDRALTSYVRPNVSAVMHNGTQLNISLIASSPALRGIERGLIHALTRSGYDMARIEAEMCTIMASHLAELRKRYAYILIDCAPGISLMTEAAIRVADLVVVPTIPDYLSVLGLNAFRSNVWNDLVDADGKLPTPKRPPHVLITRKKNVLTHQQTISALTTQAQRRKPDFKLFRSMIPEAALVPAALEQTATNFPLFLRLWGNLVPELQSLVNEINSSLSRRP